MTDVTEYIIQVLIFCLIVTPLYAFCLFILHRFRSNIFFVKRRPLLTCIICISCYLLAICEVLLSPEYTVIVTINPLVSKFIYFIGISCSASATYLSVVTRAWLLLFDIKHAEFLRSSQWWTIISYAASNKESTSFWVKYKNSLGKLSTIYKYILGFWVIFVAAQTVLVVIYDQHNLSIVICTALGLCIMLSVGIMLKHLPVGIVDVFCIRKEIKYFALIFSSGAALQFIMGTVHVTGTRLGWQIGAICGQLCSFF